MNERDFDIGPPEHLGDIVRMAVHVPKDLKYFEGHFPGDPIVPGVAQLLLAERVVRKAYPDLGPTKGIKRLKFSERVDPGDDLTIELSPSPSGIRFIFRKGEVECSRGSLVV